MGTPDGPPHALAPGRLGAAAVMFFALAATAPVLVVFTVVPAAYARGGGALVPPTFLAVGIVLILFAAGLAAMNRRAPFAGALATSVGRGLGRPAGVGAAWVAVASYHALQLGLYGLAGTAAAPLLNSWFGIEAPWWAVAAGCWAAVAICGTIRAEIVSGLLALLVLAEGAVIAGYAAANLIDPAADGYTGSTVHPAGIDRPALGLLLAVGVLAFVGFETAGAYAEESIRPRRAPGRAAYASVLVLSALLAVAAWSLSVAAGAARIGPLARARGSEIVFDLAAARLAPWAVTLGRVMLLTGLFAAMLALHHAIARYLFALGRERVLPSFLARTARRTRAPRAASLTQSLIAGLVLAALYLTGTGIPKWITVAGGLGILLVLVLAALAALLHLNRVPDGEGVWARFVAPVLSTVALGALAYLVIRNLPELLGVPPGDRLSWLIPAGLGALLLLGVLHGWALRGIHPVIYAGIGQGGAPVVVTPTLPPALESGHHREPGAHRPERVKR